MNIAMVFFNQESGELETFEPKNANEVIHMWGREECTLLINGIRHQTVPVWIWFRACGYFPEIA